LATQKISNTYHEKEGGAGPVDLPNTDVFTENPKRRGKLPKLRSSSELYVQEHPGVTFAEKVVREIRPGSRKGRGTT